MVPQELKYTKEHEWVRIDGPEAVVGVTDHAQKELGDITFVELPEVGRAVKRGDSIATVESVKAASDVYSPLSGTVIEANGSLEDAPENMNASPYGDGWIYRLSVAETGELDGLMDAAAYEAYLEEGK